MRGMSRCHYCRTAPIIWLRIFNLKSLPFDFHPVDIDHIPDDAQPWIIVHRQLKGQKVAVAVPLEQASEHARDSANRVILQHQCPEYLTHKATVAAAAG